ncbi:19839_t:CDS:2, partial [Funneliformis geosporum]
TRRKKIEGSNDLDSFLTKYQYLPELLEIAHYFDDQTKIFLNEQLGKKFYKLTMKDIKENDYISLPNIYQQSFFGVENETALEDLIIEINERKGNADVELVPPRHFAYNPARANIGSINFNESQKTGCVSPAYVVFKVASEEKINPRYLFHLLSSEQFKNQVKQICFGTVRQPLKFELFKKKITIPLLSLEEQKKISDVCLINPPKSEIKSEESIQVSFLPMEDCEAYLLYVEPTKTKKLGEIYQNYTYFAENDLLLAKMANSFENGKMSIAKNLKNAGKETIRGTAQQRISSQFVSNYFISVPPLEVQKKFIEEVKQDEKDKEYCLKFIEHQEEKRISVLDSL